MRKFYIIFSVVFCVLFGFSFAAPDSTDGVYSINSSETGYLVEDSASNQIPNDLNVTRTVIPVVPKTGPSMNLVRIILATLVIFGGYIYIKKRADI